MNGSQHSKYNQGKLFSIFDTYNDNIHNATDCKTSNGMLLYNEFLILFYSEATDRDIIESAVQEINDQTCLNWVPHDGTPDVPYIKIISAR